jgi:transcriptional regulator with XRE-family HTH domain
MNPERKQLAAELMDRLGREIRAARTEHKITVEDAAAGIGISASSLRRIENGTSRNCRGETLMQVLYWAHTKCGKSEFCGFSITPSGSLPAITIGTIQ